MSGQHSFQLPVPKTTSHTCWLLWPSRALPITKGLSVATINSVTSFSFCSTVLEQTKAHTFGFKLGSVIKCL